MSILIKGIDMPKDEKALHMRVQSDGVVRYLIEGDDPVHIIDGARAIQIPKGHGDIKDINTVEDELDERCGQLSAEIVRNAPTILEAEK